MAKETDTLDTTLISAKDLKEILEGRRREGWKVQTAVGHVLILQRKVR